MAGSINMPDSTESARKDALKRVGEAFKDEIIADAPSRTGAMIASAFSEVIDDDTVRTGFAAEYAKYQERRTDYEHDDGQAGFFSSATESIGARAEQILADEIRRKLGG